MQRRVPAVAGGFVAQGVFFDASTWSEKASTLAGIATSKVGTISFWYLNGAGADGSSLGPLTSGFGSGGGQSFNKTNTGVMQIQLQNSAGSSLLLARSVATFNVSDGWRHFLASWDLAAGTVLFYVDDAASLSIITGPTNDVIDWPGGNAQWFNFVNGGSGNGPGNLADMWFDPTSFIDFTVTANRRKFIDGSGNPVSLGSTGQTPTGSTPILYETGNNGFAGFLTNLGTGGNLTLQAGALAASSSNPP